MRRNLLFVVAISMGFQIVVKSDSLCWVGFMGSCDAACGKIGARCSIEHLTNLTAKDSATIALCTAVDLNDCETEVENFGGLSKCKRLNFLGVDFDEPREGYVYSPSYTAFASHGSVWLGDGNMATCDAEWNEYAHRLCPCEGRGTCPDPECSPRPNVHRDEHTNEQETQIKTQDIFEESKAEIQQQGEESVIEKQDEESVIQKQEEEKMQTHQQQEQHTEELNIATTLNDVEEATPKIATSIEVEETSEPAAPVEVFESLKEPAVVKGTIEVPTEKLEKVVDEPAAKKAKKKTSKIRKGANAL